RLFEAQQSRLCALADHCQISLDAVVAYDVRIRIAGLSSRQRGQLHLRAILIWMIGDEHVRAGFCHSLAKAIRGAAVSLKPELLGLVRRDREVESCTPPLSGNMRLSLIPYRNQG